jgi:hypothetical protein
LLSLSVLGTTVVVSEVVIMVEQLEGGADLHTELRGTCPLRALGVVVAVVAGRWLLELLVISWLLLFVLLHPPPALWLCFFLRRNWTRPRFHGDGFTEDFFWSEL